MSRVIAIGDIHGCDKALAALLKAVAPVADDTIVVLGDVVDRGPNTRNVIDQLLVLSKKCKLTAILGNHEEMMLKAIVDRESPYSWLQFGGASTLDSYGFNGDLNVIPESHVAFLRSFCNYHETDSHFFVHANYDPKLALSDQSGTMLRWKSLEDYLPGPHFSKKMAVVGHTADRTGEVFCLRHLTCLDTYCYGGKWLTAQDVVSGRIWQANQKGELNPER